MSLNRYRGCIIRDCQIVNVIDGKTLRVKLNPTGWSPKPTGGWLATPTSFTTTTAFPDENDWEEVDIRLMCVDTEESNIPKGNQRYYKPVTYGGREAAQWLQDHLGSFHDGRCKEPIAVDVEFDTIDASITECRRHNREAYGRMLAYVHKGGEILNLAVVRSGRSAYFTKYGRSRLYHADFVEAERLAQSEERGVWGILSAVGQGLTPVGGDSSAVRVHEYVRNYQQLVPWWSLREGAVEDFRRWQREGQASHVLVPRVHHVELMQAAHDRTEVTVLVDLQPKDPQLVEGIWKNVHYAPHPKEASTKTHAPLGQKTMTGTVIMAGTKKDPFNLWMDHAHSPEAEKVKALLHRRYAMGGRNYAYVTGKMFMYHRKNIPQMQLESADQIRDVPIADLDKLHHWGEKSRLITGTSAASAQVVA